MNFHTSSKNGCKCYIELREHLKTEAYEDTKASNSNAILKSAHYDGNRKFTLNNYYNTGLNNMIKTLDATTYQCIRSTGLLAKRFKTDKSQPRYKHVSCRYGTFCVDYLKVGVKTVRQFIGGYFL